MGWYRFPHGLVFFTTTGGKPTRLNPKKPKGLWFLKVGTPFA
jgi:hypothetical protein